MLITSHSHGIGHIWYNFRLLNIAQGLTNHVEYILYRIGNGNTSIAPSATVPKHAQFSMKTEVAGQICLLLADKHHHKWPILELFHADNVERDHFIRSTITLVNLASPLKYSIWLQMLDFYELMASLWCKQKLCHKNQTLEVTWWCTGGSNLLLEISIWRPNYGTEGWRNMKRNADRPWNKSPMPDGRFWRPPSLSFWSYNMVNFILVVLVAFSLRRS
jgi:hypothetical protein